MKMQMRGTAAVACALLLLACFAAPVAAQKGEQEVLMFVGNAEFKASLESDDGEIGLRGRTSVHMEATRDQYAKGMVQVKAMNVVFFDVPQWALTDDKPTGDGRGVLGIAITPADGPQLIKHDPKKGIMEGILVALADAPHMTSLGRIPDGKDDIVATPRQRVEISFSIRMDHPIDPIKHRLPTADMPTDPIEPGDHPTDPIEPADYPTDPIEPADYPTDPFNTREIVSQEADLDIEVHAYPDKKAHAKAFSLMAYPSILELEHTAFFRYEVARHLKIQPVRIARSRRLKKSPNPFAFVVQYTGEGLDFGLPQLRHEWGKVDVTFTINDWETVWGSDYWSFEEAEAEDLKAEVDVDDAVEVFFVNEFSPQASLWGGGCTWSIGGADSKIITSDGNARGEVDFTHLAHEVGHSMGLWHPQDPWTPQGTGNTLLCPSGWMNDNPQANSQENGDNLSNPLFTFSFKPIGEEPDCEDGDDCGDCP